MLLLVMLVVSLFSGHGASALKRQQQSASHGWRRTLSRKLNPKDLAKPDYNLYHRKDVLLAEVEALVKANSGFMTVEVQTAKDLDYESHMQIVTVEPGGITQQHGDKARMLLDFGEHSREFISAELGLLLLQTLADPGAAARAIGGGARGAQLQRLLHAVVFKIMPMENPRGRDIVEGGKLCERKNGRGVDPNRNWPLDWGKKEKDYDPNEENPGREPFSEPEVKMVHELAKSFEPHVWLNIHSGMEAMFTPYDHKAEVPKAAEAGLAMLKAIHKDVFKSDRNCVVGSGGKSVGYLAHGTATDYMFEVLKVPLPFTWEIFGDFKADYSDCFRMFNPVSKAEMQVVLTRWLKAILMLIELLPTHSGMPASFRAAAAGVAAGVGTAAADLAVLKADRKDALKSATNSSKLPHAMAQAGSTHLEGITLQRDGPALNSSGSSASVGTGGADGGSTPMQLTSGGPAAGGEHQQLLLNLSMGLASLLIVGGLITRYGTWRLCNWAPSRARVLKTLL